MFYNNYMKRENKKMFNRFLEVIKYVIRKYDVSCDTSKTQLLNLTKSVVHTRKEKYPVDFYDIFE